MNIAQRTGHVIGALPRCTHCPHSQWGNHVLLPNQPPALFKNPQCVKFLSPVMRVTPPRAAAAPTMAYSPGVMWHESCSHMLENSLLEGLALLEVHTHTKRCTQTDRQTVTHTHTHTTHTVSNVSWRSTHISKCLRTNNTMCMFFQT